MAHFEPRSFGRQRLVFAATLALAAPVTIACNSLIGLSDFDKGQCAGARCPDEGGLIDQVVPEGGTDAPQDTGPDAVGAGPVSWAQWPMPHYGDGGAGEPMTSPPLVSGDGGLVTDTITKLTWRSTLVPGTFKASAADAECRKLAGGPWRAPKRIELATLLDYSRAAPYVDTNSFTDLSLDTVWSTSEVRPFVAGSANQSYWVVNFGTGKVSPLSANTPARVLCVLAKQ